MTEKTIIGFRTADEWGEWDYRKQERLGILCGAGEPTAEQIKMAEDEADECIRKMRESEQP